MVRLPRSGSERVAIGKRSATDGYALQKHISLGEAADRALVFCRDSWLRFHSRRSLRRSYASPVGRPSGM